MESAMKMFYRLLLLEQRGQDVNSFVISEMMSQLNRTRSLLLKVSSGDTVRDREKNVKKNMDKYYMRKEEEEEEETTEEEKRRAQRRDEM